MARTLRWLAAAAAAAAIAPTPAAAGAPLTVNPHGRLLGAVPAKHAAPLRAKPLNALGASQLLYHGGAVVHDGHVYAIFWEPPGYSFPAGYKATIARYFADVAADGGKRTNVYSVNRQYGDALGKALYKVAYAGSYTDALGLPASGCTNALTDVCLTDDQLSAELGRFIAASGLPTGLTRQYFLFTPPGIGSCFDGTSDPCVYHDYCAYHSYVTYPGTVLYAVHPYVTDVASCDVGQYPSGTVADPVLNVVSHEHNEIVTDPTGGGWFDADGEENGDKCAWSFGAPFGSSGTLFNQVVAGRQYLLQLEWSNLRSGCVASEPNRAPTAFFVPSGRAVAKNRLLFDASAAKDVDGRIVSYAWRFGDGVHASGRFATHAYAHAGTYTVKLITTDDEGATGVRRVVVTVRARKRLAQAAALPDRVR